MYLLGDRLRFLSPVTSETVQFAVEGEFVSLPGNYSWARHMKDWRESSRIWAWGDYRRAVNMRSEILHEVYEKQGGFSVSDFPPLMSPSWVSNMGHLGLLMLHGRAQRLKVLPQGVRTVMVGQRIGNPEVLQLALAGFARSNMQGNSALLDWASMWSVAERLQMVRRGQEFIDIYALEEEVNASEYPPIFEFKSEEQAEYMKRSRTSLMRLGLPEDAWFVGLHTRKVANPLDPRSAPVQSFLPAIREIIRQGGFVVRFGSDRDPDLGSLPGLLDLTEIPGGSSNLDLFVLAASRFLISTSSGPTRVASELGTPVLTTNMMSIGRSVLSSAKGSLFLPKRWETVRRQPLSARQLLASRYAYCEFSSLKEVRGRFNVMPNTATEILEATREMLLNEKGKVRPRGPLSSLEKSIRVEVGAVGRGRIAESYLGLNEEWFLSD